MEYSGVTVLEYARSAMAVRSMIMAAASRTAGSCATLFWKCQTQYRISDPSPSATVTFESPFRDSISVGLRLRHATSTSLF